MPRAPSKPRACRSKYLGASLRLRGRAATVSGCARPKKRPAPKTAVPRFRVTYDASGNARPVPRRTVYRAARCSAKPAARGCAPLDIERAPWLANRPLDTSFDFGDAPTPRQSEPRQEPRARAAAPRLSRAERERILARYERGEAAPRAGACVVEDHGPDAADAWELTQRLACAPSLKYGAVVEIKARAKARAALKGARDRALGEICSLRPDHLPDPDAAACGAFFDALENCGPPSCTGPALSGSDGACPMTYSRRWRAQVEAGSEVLPDVALDVARPHQVGGHKLCFYGPSMAARRRLRAKVYASALAAIPPHVARRGPGAEESWIAERIREAEEADPRHVEWWGNDRDVLDGLRRSLDARGRSGAREGSIENLAFRLMHPEQYGRADQHSGAEEFAQYSEDSIADEIWTVWQDEVSAAPMGTARIAAMRKKHTPRGGRFDTYSAAREIARGVLRKIRSGERHVGRGKAGG